MARFCHCRVPKIPAVIRPNVQDNPRRLARRAAQDETAILPAVTERAYVSLLNYSAWSEALIVELGNETGRGKGNCVYLLVMLSVF